MGLRIQNNIAALNAHRNLTISDSNMSKSLERLSSGFRINRAADDAAGLSVSQQMRADITSYGVASRNVSEANSMLQVAEGAMDQVGNMLTRLKELATQAASANASSNLVKINAEGNKILNEIDRIAQSTEYSGTKLSNGSFGVGLSAGSSWTAAQGFQAASGMQSYTNYNVAAVSAAGNKVNLTITATLGGVQYAETIYGLSEPTVGTTQDVKFGTLGLTLTLNSGFTSTNANTGASITSNHNTAADFQVGAKNTQNDRITVSLGEITTASTGLNLAADQMLTAANAQTYLTTIDSAISTLNTRRGDVGASQNRLGYASATLATTIENTTAAESVIRDTDMAKEMTTLSKNQILMQAGTAMLAQANQAPQQLLSLFR
ncbi:MAG: A-type flagellin [Syntrophus sp. SKADARSKE-3]|nr:A-type flagellin [Syntrophus sp. SKADARSKE-3]